MGRFSPGDHLQVRRRPGYYHHGIYVSEDRVIQFGSGVTLTHKDSSSVDAVSLAQFEDGGTVGVVQKGKDSWFTGHHPAADEPWRIVARAEFLLKLQPKLPYNLIGHNCEIIANMCASGGWTESYQVRRFFGIRAYMNAAFLMWLSARSRAKLPMPAWVAPVAITSVTLSFITIGTYNHQIKRFWDEIKGDWFAHERMLDEDPRNGPSR
jgi:Lecithin retinol acyltransferase